MSDHIRLLGRHNDGIRVAFVGWQAANVSRLPEDDRFEVTIVGVMTAEQPFTVFLDVTKDQLDQLKLRDVADAMSCDDADTVFFYGKDLPKVRPVAGVVRWHDRGQIATVEVERFGDDRSVARGGDIEVIYAVFDPPLSDKHRMFVSMGLVDVQGGPS